ncbi:MAG: translocation/assembly module TamB domain-containing protein [candidate division WOR-3 bacterium]|nr:MAG: translocation/assembly module TamB domain-containing protein [candidate division WOR-3 bacterium]
MKKVLIGAAVLVALLVSIVALAGTGFVLQIVKKTVENAVEENLGLPLTIGSLRGHLFFSLRAENVQSPGLGTIDEIRLTYNPIGLLNRHIDIRSVRIQGIDIDIDALRAMLRDLPKREKKGDAKAGPLLIEIGEFSITGCSLRVMLGRVPIKASLETWGSMMSDRLSLDSLHLSAGRSMVLVSGVVPFTQSIELDLAYTVTIGMEDVGIRGTDGILSTTGTFSGLYSSPLMEAQTIVDASVLENHITGFVRSNWRLPSFDSINIEGELSVVTTSLEERLAKKDSLKLGIVLQRTRLSTEIVSRYGQLLVDGTLKGDFTRPCFEGSISGDFKHAGFHPSARGMVSFGNDVLKVRDMKIVSRRVSIELQLLADLKKKAISDGRLVLSSNDLSVVSAIVEGFEDLTGKMVFELNVTGSFEDPRGKAHLRLSDVRLYGEEMQSAEFDFTVANYCINVTRGMVTTGRGALNIAGLYEWKEKDFVLQVRGDSIATRSPEVFGTDTFFIGGEIAIDMTFSGYTDNPQGTGRVLFREISYDTFYIGDYHLDFTLEDTVLTVSLKNEARNSSILGKIFLFWNYPYDATLRLEHFDLDTYLKPTAGFVTGEVLVSGELVDPGATLATARIDTILLKYDQRLAQNLAPVVVHLEDGVISLQPTELSIAGEKLFLEGSMPLDLRSGLVDFWARSSMIELSSIGHLLQMSLLMEGNLQFDVHFQGRPRAFDIDGRLSVSNAKFETKRILIDSVECNLGLKNGVVTVENCRGRMNEGRFDVKGFANLSGGRVDTIVLAAGLDRAVYADKNFGRVVLSAEMQLSGERDSLRIDGEIVVNEGMYDAPIRLQTVIGMLTAANRPVPEQSEILKRIYCDVGISVPDRVKIANNVANLAAKADLEVKGYLARPNAYGTITAIGEGSIQYLGKKFTVVNAVVEFDNPYKIDPVIDLTATTSVAAADGDYDLYLALNGTVTNWQLQLSSNPPLPEQDIISLLLIGQRRPGEVTGISQDVDLKGKAKDYALDAIRHGIEKTTQDFLGLDKFTLSGDLSDPSTVRIGVEKSIIKGFNLIYSSGVESWELYQIGASYDLTDYVSLFTLHDQENLNTSVDLDFHLEIE